MSAMSPADASTVSTRSSPLKVNTLLCGRCASYRLAFYKNILIRSNRSFIDATNCESTHEVVIREIKWLEISGASADAPAFAAGTFSSIKSRSGVRSICSCVPPIMRSSGVSEARPSRPIAYTTGKSHCSSVAPNSIKSSSTWSWERAGSPQAYLFYSARQSASARAPKTS